MPIQTVVAEVGSSFEVPAGVRRLPVKDGLERCFPINLLPAASAPKRVGILVGLVPQLPTLGHALDVSVSRKRFGWGKNPRFGKYRVNISWSSVGFFYGHGASPELSMNRPVVGP